MGGFDAGNYYDDIYCLDTTTDPWTWEHEGVELIFPSLILLLSCLMTRATQSMQINLFAYILFFVHILHIFPIQFLLFKIFVTIAISHNHR